MEQGYRPGGYFSCPSLLQPGPAHPIPFHRPKWHQPGDRSVPRLVVVQVLPVSPAGNGVRLIYFFLPPLLLGFFTSTSIQVTCPRTTDLLMVFGESNSAGPHNVDMT